MKMAALFSGGKDSTYAVWKAVQRGDEIVSLVSFISENPDSYMFHRPNVEWTRLQAEAMGFPIILVKTMGEKEEELADLESALRNLKGIEGVASGALASEYQKSRVDRICSSLGLEGFSPAWKKDPEAYWEELLAAGFKVVVVKVACDGLGKEWLGREIDRAAFEELKSLAKKHRFHLAFEGGEAETFVMDCPLFKSKIEIKESGKSWDGETGTFTIKRASLKGKDI